MRRALRTHILKLGGASVLASRALPYLFGRDHSGNWIKSLTSELS